jgi:branched-chain amino acid transport system substrate-binding protein
MKKFTYFFIVFAAFSTIATAQETIKIGLHGPLSGSAAQMGVDQKSGVDMAMDEVNKSGGVKGKKIEIVFYDDEAKPDKSVNVAEKLISQGVVAIIGSNTSANNLAIGPVAESSKIPYIANGTLVKTTRQGWKYTFRTAVADDILTYCTADYLVNSAKYKRIAIIHETDAFGAGYAENVAANIKKLGGNIVETQSYSRGDRDFAGQILKLREANPDVIMEAGYAAESAGITRQVRKLFKNPVAIQGVDIWGQEETLKLAGVENAIGVVYNNAVCVTENDEPTWKSFEKSYIEIYKKTPTVQAVKGYVSLKLLAKAINDSDSINPEKIRNAIAGIKGWKTPLGVYSCDENGDGLKNVVMIKIISDKKREIVYRNF